MVQIDGDWSVSAEIKAEERFTGNLFLETWSNKVFAYEYRRPGWMVTLGCDILLCYFLDKKRLYSIPFGRLWSWFWEQTTSRSGGRAGSGRVAAASSSTVPRPA